MDTEVQPTVFHKLCFMLLLNQHCGKKVKIYQINQILITTQNTSTANTIQICKTWERCTFLYLDQSHFLLMICPHPCVICFYLSPAFLSFN